MKYPDDLLPCPFCGSKTVKIKQHDHFGSKTFCVHCVNQKCVTYGPLAEDIPKAMQKWNARAKQ